MKSGADADYGRHSLELHRQIGISFKIFSLSHTYSTVSNCLNIVDLNQHQFAICHLNSFILIEYLLTFASHSAFPSPSPLICPHSNIRLQSCIAFLHCVLSFACARTFTINLSPPLFSASRTVCSALRFLPICLVYCLSLNNPTILCMIH